MGRTALLGQMLEAWRLGGEPPTWEALRASAGGLGEALCLIQWPGGDGDAVIAEAGAQAVLAYGAPLAGQPLQVLTPGRADAADEADQARALGEPFTVEDELNAGGARRIARQYLPLAGNPSAVACTIVRIE
jgi:hypothetical protein